MSPSSLVFVTVVGVVGGGDAQARPYGYATAVGNPEGSGGGAFDCSMGNAGLDVTKVVGKIFGDDGKDLILGSWETNDAAYQDDLSGDGDLDTIMAYPGADNITLGSGEDEGWGGTGVDQMCAEDDDYDELHGGNHQDNLWGDEETDHAWGDGNEWDGCRADVVDTCELTLVHEPASCPTEITAYPL